MLDPFRKFLEVAAQMVGKIQNCASLAHDSPEAPLHVEIKSADRIENMHLASSAWLGSELLGNERIGVARVPLPELREGIRILP